MESKETSKASEVYEMKADRIICNTQSHFLLSDVRIKPTAIGSQTKPPDYSNPLGPGATWVPVEEKKTNKTKLQTRITTDGHFLRDKC